MNMPDLRLPAGDTQGRASHLSDLAMIWLHIGPDNQVSEHRHCVRFQSHDQVTAISCSCCGDGPLVIGHEPLAVYLPAAVHRWLEDRGWSTDSEVLCTNHS